VSIRQLRAVDPDADGGNASFTAGPSRPRVADRRAENHEEREHTRASPRRKAIVVAATIAILVGGCWALLGSSFLVVRHVEVTGNRLVTAAQVRKAARISNGAPLITLNTNAAVRRVEQLAPVLSATVRKSWPDTVVISVRERAPVFAVAADGRYQLVDPHGVTVRWASRKPPSMPLLTSPPAVLRDSPAVHAAAVVFAELSPGLRKRLRSVSAASASSVTLHLRGRVTVLWGGTGDPAQKLAELAMLLRRNARYYDISDPTTAVTQG
jgi:cell division protein FtsQ